MSTPDDLDCQDLVEIVTEYLEGTLSIVDHLRLEAHLRECDGCDEYLAQMRTTQRVIGKADISVLSQSARARFIDMFAQWQSSG